MPNAKLTLLTEWRKRRGATVSQPSPGHLHLLPASLPPARFPLRGLVVNCRVSSVFLKISDRNGWSVYSEMCLCFCVESLKVVHLTRVKNPFTPVVTSYVFLVRIMAGS